MTMRKLKETKPSKMRDETAKKRRINPLNPVPVEPLPATLNEAHADPHIRSKIKGKPIPEGFKIWSQGYDGYVDDWLFHSVKRRARGDREREEPSCRFTCAASTNISRANVPSSLFIDASAAKTTPWPTVPRYSR
jgi:hypothetical protein